MKTRTFPTKARYDTKVFRGGAGDWEVEGRGQVLQICASCQALNSIAVEGLPYLCYRCGVLNYPNANPWQTHEFYP